ncbi:non-ribosomal peptide synthetase, partial [Chamaesiphon polymorphus]
MISEKEKSPVASKNIEAIYPLSPMQKGMLFHSLYAPESGVYVEQMTLILTGDINVDAFESAWQKVVDRHSVLRTLFVWENRPAPLQVVLKQVDLPWTNLNWLSLSPVAQQQQLSELLQIQREQGFEFGRAPLMGCTLIQLTDDTYQLIWNFHHILLDGWCLPIIFNEVLSFYKAQVQGKICHLPIPTPYEDYIDWLTAQDRAASTEFWQQMLQGFSAPTPLVVDRTLPQSQQSGSTNYQELELDLSSDISHKLQALAQQHQVTLSSIIQAGWGLLLSRYSGERDILFGVTVSGRPASLSGVENMVGLFINTLPLRLQISPDRQLIPWLEQIQQLMLELQHYSYTPLVEIQSLSEVVGGIPLFESIVVFENYPMDSSLDNETGSLQVGKIEGREQTNFPLTVTVAPRDELSIKISYDAVRFAEDTIERMLGHLQTIFAAIATNPHQTLSELPLLSESERHQLLFDWNDTAREYPQDKCIHQLFEEQVTKTPDAIAVVFERQELTYRQLNHRANQLAHYLQTLGVKPEVLVGICVERSLEMVVGLLGILKAGGAYVPLDASYPQQRLVYMVQDAQAQIVLTQESLRQTLPVGTAQLVCLDTDWSIVAQQSDAQLSTAVTAENLAYAIYTSGSTGQPKGVQLNHRPLVNLIEWQIEASNVPTEAKTLQFAPISFDVSFQEIFSTLCVGGTLVVISDDKRKDTCALIEFLRQQEIERLFLPFIALQNLAEIGRDRELVPSLQEVITAGEQLQITPAIVEWFSRHPNCALHNHYGPSETHVVTDYQLTGDPQTWKVLPPIGRPIFQTQIFILDVVRGQPVPIGVTGELFIGVKDSIRGYLNRPELTAEKFIPNPFSPDSSARLYKTGDLARYLPDGNIEFLGRLDHQVKIRGFRIELGEIEAVISSHPHVRQAVAIATTDAAGNQRLVAYVVSEAQTFSTQQLREFLHQQLPAYMVPSAFVILDTLPLTPNGKVDRKALPAPDGDIERTQEYVAPHTPSQEIVAQIFAAVLGVEKVGIHDNFFELGGHSLLATQLTSRLKHSFTVDIPLQAVFEAPSVAQLERTITQLRTQGQGWSRPAIERIASGSESIPLSFAQERLWFLNQLEGASATYNMPAALGLTGDLNLDALHQALTEIVRRHESLRTSFTTVNGQPMQMIHSSASMTIETMDLQHLIDTEREVAIEQHIQQSALTSFDLEIAPLIRCSLLQLAETDYVFCINMHHIVSDGWSIGVLVRELSVLYSAYCAGNPSPLPELEIQYADFALWQREYLSGEVLEQQLEYWVSQLQGAPELLQLPTDRPRPSVQTYQGKTQSFTLSLALTQQLQALSRQTGSTLFMTLMAAFATLLYRYSGQSDVVIGSPIANRNRSEIEQLIGFFVNTLVLRTDLQHNPSFIELLHRVRQVTLDAYAHQDVPFEKLVETLQPERNQSYSPLFQVGFVLQNTSAESQEMPGLTLTPLEIESTTAKYDLTLSIQDTDRGLISAWEYNSDLFDLTTITRMADNFQTLLTGIVANPQQQISELPLLNKEEQQQLLWDWNDTEAEYASNLCIHQLFAAQAASTPQAIALTFQDRQLTYQELNSRANQLAHYLQKMGVGVETLVGICIDRSPEMLIGLWGILKAGGAYVPLDASYPLERLAYMLSDAKIKMLLTTKNLEAGLPAHAAQVVCLDTDWEEIATESAENPVSNVQPQSLAYVIYTSGSTGTPKGVMVPHRGLCNLAQAQIKLFDVQPTSKVLQFASSSFDASISEIVMTQCTGATLYLDPKEALLPGDTLSDYLQAREITHLTLPPTALAVMPLVPLPQLQTIIVAGEACPQELIARWATGRNFFNAYGPTEGTVCATVSEPLDGSKPAPIGKPIPNVRVYILDDRLQPVPVGVPGELYIAGVGIARGYLNRPDLTAEKFISNPYDNEPYERLYKTGDRARYLPDGNIEFLGRIDHQVKLRGYRIELGEIESLLSKHSQVREAVVVGREDRSGDRRLVAYVVPQLKNLTTLTEREHPQSDRIELWPSVAEYYVYDELLYYAMTNDLRRNDSYKVAIEQLVVDKIVVEIGTGKDAILARFCAEAGAKKVYAIERNEQTCQQANACIQELGLSDKIVVVHGDATLVELPELADICVSEIVGAIGGCEGAAVIINNSRRLLKPDGVMIPHRSVTKVAAVTLSDEILHNPHFTPTSGHYTHKIFEQVGYPFDLRVCIKKFPHANVLSNADVFEDLDFNRHVDPNFSHKIELTIHQSGRLDGFLVWLTLQTIPGEEIDILKHEHCWLPVYFPVFEPGIAVDDGDVIQAVCSRSLCDNHLNPDYAIVGQLIRKNGEVIDFEHISYHYREVFQRTPFYQKLFSNFDRTEVNSPDTLTNSLRGYLQEILPNYMIPAAFVELENFPLTPNGKVDRKALPAPDGDIEREQEYVAPHTPNQEIIAHIFTNVLGIEKVGIHDNFFELGGHSLLATQLTSR